MRLSLFAHFTHRVSHANSLVRATWSAREAHKAEISQAWRNRKERWAATDRSTRGFLILMLAFLAIISGITISTLFHHEPQIRQDNLRGNLAELVTIAKACPSFRQDAIAAIKAHRFDDTALLQWRLRYSTQMTRDRISRIHHSQALCSRATSSNT